MVNFYDFFVDPRKAPFSREVRDLNRRLHKEYPHDPRRVYEGMEKWKQEKGLMPTPLSVLIDHLVHIAKVAGIDHVGLGSDFDGCHSLPQGMEDISRLPNITLELLKRGYSDKDIRKVLGENLLRVMSQVERVAEAH